MTTDTLALLVWGALGVAYAGRVWSLARHTRAPGLRGASAEGPEAATSVAPAIVVTDARDQASTAARR